MSSYRIHFAEDTKESYFGPMVEIRFIILSETTWSLEKVGSTSIKKKRQSTKNVNLWEEKQMQTLGLHHFTAVRVSRPQYRKKETQVNPSKYPELKK